MRARENQGNKDNLTKMGAGAELQHITQILTFFLNILIYILIFVVFLSLLGAASPFIFILLSLSLSPPLPLAALFLVLLCFRSWIYVSSKRKMGLTPLSPFNIFTDKRHS